MAKKVDVADTLRPLMEVIKAHQAGLSNSPSDEERKLDAVLFFQLNKLEAAMKSRRGFSRNVRMKLWSEKVEETARTYIRLFVQP